jgi:hypothetical protein
MVELTTTGLPTRLRCRKGPPDFYGSGPFRRRILWITLVLELELCNLMLFIKGGRGAKSEGKMLHLVKC